MRILVCHRDSGSQKLIDRLRPLLPGMELVDSAPGKPIGPLDGVDALLAVGPVDRPPMEQGKFGFIQTVSTGYDHIDIPSATKLGIRVAHAPASMTGNAESVAELAILLMLSLSRRVADAQEALREQRWAQPLGRSLLGKTACIVGLGSVGTALAHRLNAFGMKITATRKDTAKGAPSFVDLHPGTALREVLTGADVVILCARASEETNHLIDAEMIASMKQGSLLINVARGSLLDHGALRDALDSGHLAGAGLDVFWEEPVNPEHPLFRLRNVIATPHIGGVTDVNLAGTFRLVAENLTRYANGEMPHFLVNDPPHPRGA